MRSTQRFASLITIVVAAVALTGCGYINIVRSKDRLNEGAREFNKGHYDVARGLFEQSMELDPSNKFAALFYAMTLNAQFEQKPSEELGKQAVKAFENVIAHSKSQGSGEEAKKDIERTNQAYAFIANLYDAMSGLFEADKEAAKIEEYKNLRREWLQKRADLPGQTKEVRCQMFYSIGQSHWKDAHDTLVRYMVKPTDPREPPTWNIPDDKKPIILKGMALSHEYLDKALSENPEYADAFAYKKILYIDESKVHSDPEMKRKLLQQATEADETYREKAAAQRLQEAAAASESGEATEESK